MSRKYNVGARIWRVLYPFLLHNLVQGLVCVLAAVVFSILYIPGYMESISSGYGTNTYIMNVMSTVLNMVLPIAAVASIISIPFLIWYMRRDVRDRKETGEYVKYRFPNVLKLLVAILLGLTGCFVGNVLMSLVGLDQMSSSFQTVNSAMMSGTLPLQILCGGIIVPIAEELVYRGLAYRRLRDTVNMPVAMLLSALLFGLAHGNIVQGLYAFALGLVMAFTYERFQTIIAPILIHMAANTLSFIVSDERFAALFTGMRLIMIEMVIAAILFVLSLLFVIFFVHPKKVEDGKSHDADIMY